MSSAKKVLVVEDSVTFRGEILKALKEIPSIEITGVAGHGGEALELILKNHFDIIISDIEMPVMNGLELLKELNQRKSEKFSRLFTSTTS